MCAVGDVYKLSLKPKVVVPALRLSDESPTCAKWSPHAPYNELLVGTVWGTVAVILLHEAAGSTAPSFTVCSLVRTGISSIRCLAWAPVNVQPGEEPGDNSTLFCVCAGQALITIYDTRQPQVPVLDLSLGTQGVHGYLAHLCPHHRKCLYCNNVLVVYRVQYLCVPVHWNCLQ